MTCHKPIAMQFTTKTLLVLFLVLASSFAAFDLFAIIITPVCICAICLCVWRNCGCALAFIFGLVAVFILLLLPAVSCVREAARRCACVNNMKQLGLALYNYHDDYGCFPPAYTTDDQGNRLHGWRTLILPYCEQKNLYQSLNLNKPWDGPKNSQLAATNLYVFKCLSVLNENKPRTHYVAVTGPGTAWPDGRGSRVDEFTDGTKNTILLIEMSDSDINWMEPRDVTIDEALGPMGGRTSVPRSSHCIQGTYWFRPRPLAGSVLMADGSVRFIKGRLSRDDLTALLSPAGGEPVDVDEIIDRSPPDEPSLKYFRWDHAVGLPLFILSLLWFWRRLVADSKLNLPKSEPEQEAEIDADEN